MEKTNSASMDALLLSLVTIAYSVIGTLFTIQGFLAIALWIAKFAGTLYLLYYFMMQYTNSRNVVTYKDAFKYGFKVSLFSSILCAGFTYLSMTLIFREKTAAIIDLVINSVMQQAQSGEEEEMISRIAGKIPEVTLISSLIYYTVLGLIYSAILANFTKRETPFFTEDQLSDSENQAE